MEEHWQKIWQVIERETGVNFSYYRQTIVRRRVETWSRRQGIHNLEELLVHLDQSGARARELVNFITVDVSSFFRNRRVFQYLTGLLARYGDKPFNAISLGCGRGEELYSLAINLQKVDALSRARFLIGLDIDGENLRFAWGGTFHEKMIRSLSDDERNRFGIEKTPDRWQVRTSIRNRLKWIQGDIFRLPIHSESMDLVLIRNVLIFIEPRYHDMVFEEIARILRPGGYLTLGAVERLPPRWRDQFQVVSVVHHVYQKGRK